MNPIHIFAAEQINVDPKVTEASAWIMGLVLLAGVVMVIKEVIVLLLEHRREQDAADRNIRFDTVKSVLYRNYREVDIPDNSLEHYVCKLVFEELNKPQLDINILEAAGKPDDYDPRAIEQAVRRVNKKASKALDLKEDLLIRRKEKTFLNDIDKLI